MSRIIVRNLPEKVTEDKLRSVFSEKGVITDVQLKYTKDGKFRRFAFIGYKTPEQANAAIETLNNTFINTSRIEVATCAGLTDPNKPRSWSKYATDSSAFKKKHKPPADEKTEDDGPAKKKKKKDQKIKDPKIEELLKSHKDDLLFKEFIETHLPDADELLKIASDEKNDAAEDKDTAEDDEEEADDEEEKLANKNISDLDYLKLKSSKKLTENEKKEILAGSEVKSKNPIQKLQLFTVKVQGLPFKTLKNDVKVFLKPAKIFNIRILPKVRGIAFCTFKTEAEMKKALLKHRSFYAGKRISVMESKHAEDKPSKESNEKWKLQEESLKNEETIAESGRIFVRNLPYTCTEDEVTELFQKYGPISDTVFPIDPLTRRPKGYGIITFLFPEHAHKAFSELDGTVFQGRMLHLLAGLPAKSADDEEENETEGNFKKKKLKNQKSKAGSSTNWNTFFIGENSLAEAMAATYNTAKENVLDDKNGGVAVRLALGETQIINQIKEFLIENDVKLDSFVNMANCARSKTVILVKNLPFGTTVEEIRERFGPLGQLKKIVLPPQGIAALVEFIEPFEAKKAFKKLAYSKFKHVPLYLEWAPDGVFSDSKRETEGNEGNEGNDVEDGEKEKDEGKLSDDENAPIEGATIFVKNLNFSTNSAALHEHFSRCGRILSATVAQKKDPSDPTKNLSLGYGFVQFSTKESADEALKTLQFSKLDDHRLELKRSHRTTKEEEKTVKKKTKTGKPSSKILVRNIPFQANRKEVEKIFQVFGEIKAIRLPKKMVGTGSHRGFCFVEFHSISDAKRAFKALSDSTHFYGRRLVLEWAEADDDVEELRRKTARSFNLAKTSKKKNVKIDDNKVADDEED